MAGVELLLTATSMVCWLTACVVPLLRITRRGLYVPRDFFGWYALCASLLAFVFVVGPGLWVTWTMSAAGALLTGRLTGWMRGF
jgi:hypothetical protein